MLLPPRKKKATQTGIATPGSKVSRDAVFQITELLEQILEYLSWKDLHLCQRVCRRFHDLISDSHLLRQKMTLFRPNSLPSHLHDEPPNRLDPAMLRPLATGTRKMFARDFGLVQGQRVCPLLEQWPRYFNWKSSLGRPPSSIPFTFKIASGQNWTMLGSWRRVYLTDPPVKTAHVRMVWSIEGVGALRFNGIVRDEDGLTFGRLLDLVLGESKKCWTFMGYTHQVGNANRNVPGDTPAETIRWLEGRLGGKAELRSDKSYVVFGPP
ncbi:hypothetical protein M409DRAFT_53701 [Zasmidium cellare ATCC 36951]|uniref:F-box domain-containing protein n=1 Tax=Zasmidium cellare ATCC 36951 TaxID=1080233 RepID=A0A6A6CKF8_ZASCE|nr:uncharacterized protein M409DRAFT_53701 [Zasmidium cellare ATCC 36951]KAF2167727.1 hypothetical protein M409DRAFT_53701 [Zasmidium cellare ATCC 36951]